MFSASLKDVGLRNPNVYVEYLEGPGTQSNAVVRVVDGALGYTYDSRLEAMYELFSRQARDWLKEDPRAEIRVLATGFSRGADQAAGFTRMVHERGIKDPRAIDRADHRDGPDEVAVPRPLLVSPGRIPQAVALFDPVGTGTPHRRDRHLPSSVVSGFQIVARDERRNQFPSSQIIPQGMSADGRFLGVTVPGAHSDIGGSYHVDGLARLNGNLMADYINALSDVPLVHKRELPSDPERYVIHRSEEHLFIYGTSTFERDGMRDVMGAQISPPHCRLVVTCAPPDPVDPVLAASLGERRPVGQLSMAVAYATSREFPMQAPDHRAMEQPPARRFYDLDRSHAIGNIPLPGERMLPGWSPPSPAVSGGRYVDHAHEPVPGHPGSRHDASMSRERAPLHAHDSIHVASPQMGAARGRSELPEAMPSSPPDPRHPQHPAHAMYRSVRGQLHELYAEQSISLSDTRLENMTAAIMADARRANITRVTSMEFSYDDNDRPDVNRYIFVYNGDPRRDGTPESSTDVQAASVTPPEQSYQQFHQAAEHHHERALQRQLQQAREHSHGMGHSL